MQSPSETPSSDDSPPRNKGGRPKGSKTRPKWLREALKRPRGRPKGSKNKPKTILGWLQESLEIQEPKRAPRKLKDEKAAEYARKGAAMLTPERRSELAKKASLAAKAKGKPGGRPLGVPAAYKSQWAYRAEQDAAKQDVKRIISIMAEEGILPEDPLAREALETALQLMREAGPKDFKHKVLRTILEYRLAKPAQKQDVTVRTAEDFLDELAAKESDEPSDERSAP